MLKNLRDFIYWKYQDFKTNIQRRKLGIHIFDHFGLRMYTGRQGSGKTASLVNQLDRWHEEYPNLKICTNFDYQYADYQLESLEDIMNLRNGTDGLVFAIDELQNEFSSASSKSFDEKLLSTVTMQRKQRICILATSQVFTRVAKPLREQCYEVVECKTWSGRWTHAKCFDAEDYFKFMDSVDKDKKRRKIWSKWRYSFVQSDDFRKHYDTYSVVKRLARNGIVKKEWETSS